MLLGDFFSNSLPIVKPTKNTATKSIIAIICENFVTLFHSIFILNSNYKRKSKIKNRTIKQAKNPTILANKETASFLRCSRKRHNGSYKNRNPIIKADNTKSPSIVMGMKILFCGMILFSITLFMAETIITIYKAAADAYKNGFFIPVLYQNITKNACWVYVLKSKNINSIIYVL